jgi:predicted phosphodiesterase
MRVFAISDVHTDFRDNLQLLGQLSTQSFRDDALIVAGDVSHDLGVLRQTLLIFVERFRYVFYVPGNHELWIRKGEHEDSVQKFHDVLRLCESLGVYTGPEVVGSGEDRVRIVPLFSWYARPADGSDSLHRDRGNGEPGRSVWTDDYLVKWPGKEGSFRPVPFFLEMNVARLRASSNINTISFSHFLPRQDLMFPAPGEAPLPPLDPVRAQFNFSSVAGSTLIEQQIRTLGSRVHVYGHQHRNRRRYYDGIWYVSNCLGYPEERGGQTPPTAADALKAVWPALAET